MLSIAESYQNGYVKLDKEYLAEKAVQVVISMMDNIEASAENGLLLSDLSFARSKQAFAN